MTYVVTEKCVDCKYTTCVSVCPVDAFHELPDRLYINPETCIDCNACMDECPVEAICPDMDVPDELQEWIELNEKAEDYPQLVGQLDLLKVPSALIPTQINNLGNKGHSSCPPSDIKPSGFDFILFLLRTLAGLYPNRVLCIFNALNLFFMHFFARFVCV